MKPEMQATNVTHILFRPEDKFQVITVTTDDETMYLLARSDVTAQAVLAGDESGIIRPFEKGNDALSMAMSLNQLP